MNMNKTATILSCALLLAGITGSRHPLAAQTSADDKQFLSVAGQADLAEIKQSELALQKSKNKDVRAFAKKMISDHRMLMAEMKPFADKYNVPPPVLLSTAQQSQYAALKSLSGKAFDKAYIEDMDKDHHKALELFNAEAGATKDADLKAKVTTGQAVVAGHAQMADTLAQKMGVMVATGNRMQRDEGGL